MCLRSSEAQANDHLAVSSSTVHMEAKGRLFVLPPVMRVRNIAIRPRRTRVYAGTIPARAGGSGTEFFGVREYQPGDSPHSINWRASARNTDTLYANEYQQERVADVGIVLDGRLRTNEFAHGNSLFEYSVQAAASIADALLTQGNRVGLIVVLHLISAGRFPVTARSSANGFCTRWQMPRPVKARSFLIWSISRPVCFRLSRRSCLFRPLWKTISNH